MSYAWPSLLLPSLDFSFSLHQFLWYFLLPSFPLPPILINHTIFYYGENGFKWFSSKPSPCCCYSVTFKLQIWAWLLQSPACFDPAYLTNPICYLSFSVILFQALVCSLKGFTQSSVRWECFLHSNIPQFISTHYPKTSFQMLLPQRNLWDFRLGFCYHSILYFPPIALTSIINKIIM